MSDIFDTDGQDEGNGNEYRLDIKPMRCTEIVTTAQTAIYRAESNLIDAMQDAQSIAMAIDAIDCIKAKIKSAENAVQERAIELMNRDNLYKADVGGGKVLIKSTVKTNKFDTKQIYKALDVPEYLQDILPANPAFRVTAVRLNEKIAHLTWEESKDVVKVSISDAKFLKEG